MDNLLWELGLHSLKLQSDTQSWKKHDSSELTQTDLHNHTSLINFIQKEYPNDSIISEEGEKVIGNSGNIWFIDPLDGTREYSMKMNEWCIQVCQWNMERNEPLSAWIWEADNGGILWSWNKEQDIVFYENIDKIKHQQPRMTDHQECIHVISRGHPDEWTQKQVELLPGRVIYSGSAGVKVCKLLKGEATHYWNGSGKMKVWDWAAPYAIGLAAGLNIYINFDSMMLKWRPKFTLETIQVNEKILFTSHSGI
jgi:3'(2'), 5'-bisphosphate nucleotidase